MNVAIVGLGFVGRAHLEAARRLGASVCALAGKSRRESGEMRWYGSYEELLADDSLDVVHICTPNNLHLAQSLAALRAEHHVICEKPLAMNPTEARELIAAACESNRVGAVCHNLRYYPMCQEAHALVKRGDIGEPRIVYGTYLQDWLFSPFDWNWRLEPGTGGAMRAVADIGTHWLDLMMWISGQKITSVCADMATLVPVRHRPRSKLETFQRSGEGGFDEVRMNTEDYASVLLRFDRGLRGVVTISQVSAGRKNRLWWEIDGSEASLAWDGENPNLLWIGHRNQANRLQIKDPSLMSPEARGYAAYPGGHAEGYPDTFIQLFKDVYAYVAAGDFSAPRSFPTFETGAQELLLCEAISRSASEERWITVEQIARS